VHITKKIWSGLRKESRVKAADLVVTVQISVSII
jgi:hypothetical protein